ncbi:hypothetical protein FRC17_001497 [Serendipita sp. 399]|nr:hypothetical protein FRC17_001497 [Serendipita sp. 399]
MSVDDRVSTAQVQKAIKSLLSYSAKKKKETQEAGKTLFADEDENVWLVVTTKTMSPSLSFKPQRIPIAHPIVDPRKDPVCLITKDPQREYKDLLEKHNVKFISRVVGITKLKGKFSPYDARRELAREYGLFLADERVVPLLPNLLGKVFFKKKKQPIPVNLQRANLKAELEAAISSTYLHQNAGTCTSIKIGHTGMDASKIIQNAEKAIPGVVRKLHLVNTKRKGKPSTNEWAGSSADKLSEEELKEFRETAWENIQSLGIKTHSSVCLPIWSCSLSERWITPSKSKGKEKAAATNGAVEEDGFGEDDNEDDTMSEGESAKENGVVAAELSRKMAESSLGSPKKSKLALPADPASGGKDGGHKKTKEKKRKAEEQEDDGARSTKKSKPSTDSISAPIINKTGDKSSSKQNPKEKKKEEKVGPSSNPNPEKPTPARTEKKVQPTPPQPALSSAASAPKAGKEKPKKVDQAKAADFMEDAVVQEVAKKNGALKQDVSSKSTETGSVHTPKEKLKGKKEGGKKSAEKGKGEEEQRPKEKGEEKPKGKVKPANKIDAAHTNGTTKSSHSKPKEQIKASTPSTLSSKPSSAPPSTLKPALKKPDSSASLTPEELAEKKARKASFSVAEKKKEKVSKGVLTGGQPGHGKSGKGGKSKASLVGRGPKM